MTILKEFDQRMDSDISEFIREIESVRIVFVFTCTLYWLYAVKKEVFIAHQIRCADKVAIRTPFLDAQHTITILF